MQMAEEFPPQQVHSFAAPLLKRVALLVFSSDPSTVDSAQGRGPNG